MIFAYWRYYLEGNRLIKYNMADMRHPGNRLSEDAHFHYKYDQYGNLSQKISKRDAGEVHYYRYDRSHRLVSYLCYQDGEALRGGRYCYDPLGRRIGKQVMLRNQPKHISWFGWDGDKLVLTERDGTRIHTVYLPHSFVPLLRFEGDKPPTVTPLADKLEQEVGITLPLEFKQTLHHIEQALRANRLSEEQHTWLNQIQLNPDYLATLLDPLPNTPYAAQLYDCNHLGTPQQLINLNGHIDWSITLDAWGNTLSEENPHQLHQPIRMQGQQYDEESGLHYNRHRYYDPTIGRYITQDPIGLRGGMNAYSYVYNIPISLIDVLGLDIWTEGAAPDEVDLHLSVNVGTFGGEYDSYSYGMGAPLIGEVYKDINHGGQIYQYKKTTQDQDIEFKKLMDKKIGDWSIYGINDICRSWSIRQFNLAPGTLTPPPSQFIPLEPDKKVYTSSSRGSSTTGSGTSK